MSQPPQAMSPQPQPNPQPKPKLRWFQFGIRTPLILMTVLCVGLAWLIHDIHEQEAVVKLIEERYGTIQYGEPSFLGRTGIVRSLFGEHAFTPVTHVAIQQATNADLEKLKVLSNLQWLQIIGSEITDLSPLTGLSELAALNLTFTRVSDLSPLAKMRGLNSLMVADSPVSDLAPLARMNGLTSLVLEDLPVSDLSPVSKLSRLTELHLVRTKVSDLTPLVGLHQLDFVLLQTDQEVLIPASLNEIVDRSSAP